MAATRVRIPAMRTLVLATRNRHKAEEIRALLGPGWRCLTLADFPGAPPVEEDGDSFAANARKKALSLVAWLRSVPQLPGLDPGAEVWILADDSGLEVDALGGLPGVHSARFAALDSGQPGNSRDEDNNAKLLRLLARVPAGQRGARFRCVVALAPVRGGAAATGDEVHLFEGTCAGQIELAPRGTGGFGYDPLFRPEGFTQTFAELGEAQKNQLSHRARALAQVRAWLESRSGEAGSP